MEWIKQYQLFLFDFDGLLVDTEPVHFAAYRKLCNLRGFDLDWTLDQYCQAAHLHSMGMREALYDAFPALEVQEPDWNVLYAEKKVIYRQMLDEGRVGLLEGVEPLLKALEREKIKRCVVTNSPLDQIEAIRSSQPVLQTIPLWVTREDYARPKPDPEGYLKAIALLASPGDKVIGFEDSLKGLQALIQAGVDAVLVCPRNHPQMRECSQLPKFHFESLSQANI